MTSKSFFPPPALAAYASHLLALERPASEGELSVPLIANGYAGITFQVGSNTMPTLFLHGQTLAPVELHAESGLILFTCFLYPPALLSLFGIAVAELTDQYIDLRLVQPAAARDLQEQLQQCSMAPERLEVMSAYLQKLVLSLNSGINQPVYLATHNIRQSRGLLPLKQLQAELRLTERGLQRLFEFHMGLSPKLFSRICQFQSAFQKLNLQPQQSLTGLALDHGYADQSHFIRSFKAFANCSPSAYLKKCAALGV